MIVMTLCLAGGVVGGVVEFDRLPQSVPPAVIGDQRLGDIPGYLDRGGLACGRARVL